MTNATMFRTSTSKGLAAEGRVDRKTNTIFGASLMQLGQVNDDRPWLVDETTLQQVIDLHQANGKRGTKARFAHPSMSNDGLGKHLGRWSNVRRDGDHVRGDLSLAESAFDTPSGDLGTYVLDLAEEDPGAFGVSAAGVLDEEAMFGPDAPAVDVPIRFVGLRAADVVDEPAATRGGLFSVGDLSGEHKHELPYAVQWIIDHHFSAVEPEELLSRFRAFVARHFNRKDLLLMSTDTKTTETDSAADNQNAAATDAKFREDAKPFVEAFGDQGATWFLEGKPIEECFKLRHDADQKTIADLNSQVADLNDQIAKLREGVGESEELSSDRTGDEETTDTRRAKIIRRRAS